MCKCVCERERVCVCLSVCVCVLSPTVVGSLRTTTGVATGATALELSGADEGAGDAEEGTGAGQGAGDVTELSVLPVDADPAIVTPVTSAVSAVTVTLVGSDVDADTAFDGLDAVCDPSTSPCSAPLSSFCSALCKFSNIP